MRPALYPIPALVVVVFLLVRAGILKKQRQFYILKPISTLLVILVASLSFLEPVWNLTYIVGVMVGLALSFGGDMALMFEEDRKAFVLGLGFFLLAHVSYTAAFTILGGVSAWDFLSIAVLLAAGVGFYILILPKLGKMRVPVIVYILVISVMVNRAASTLHSPVFNNGQASMILAGALLFYSSDVILAAHRFWRPWRFRRISLGLYYSGQLLIALAASCFV
jgi:uncharacterized membrane protein YhhN